MKTNSNKIVVVMLIAVLIILTFSVVRLYDYKNSIANLEERVIALELIIEESKKDTLEGDEIKELPETELPETEPPAEETPVKDPPRTSTPSTKPSSTKPPATKPPAEEPPAQSGSDDGVGSDAGEAGLD